MIRASLKPSRVLAAALLLAHCASAATLIPVAIPIGYKALLAAAIAASLVRSLWRHAWLRAGRSIVELQVLDREHAAIRRRRGDWCDARILGTSCVTPALTAINLRVEGSIVPQHVVLVRDSVHPDDFRKIRVLLRWARPQEGAPAEAGR